MNTLALGSFIAAIGVILGAFGTHGLKGKVDDDLLKIYETGTHYLMIHAFAILIYGVSQLKAAWPLWCFGIGIVIFSGSLFAITFTGIKMFGAITPIGGLLFIAGWIGFGINALGLKK